MKKSLLSVCLFCVCILLSAQDIILSNPSDTNGEEQPFFVKREMSRGVLSDLVWAACTIQRENKNSTPSSHIDVYVILESGIYFYRTGDYHILKIRQYGDFRDALGQPNITNSAALTLVYVANISKILSKETAFIDAGFMAQDVYLNAIISRLNTVTRGSFKRPDLHKAMKLTDKQEIIMVQSVGYSR